MSALPKIKFCPKCHRRADNPFAKMNLNISGGGKLVSTCSCGAKILWKDKRPVPAEPVEAAK